MSSISTKTGEMLPRASSRPGVWERVWFLRNLEERDAARALAAPMAPMAEAVTTKASAAAANASSRMPVASPF